MTSIENLLQDEIMVLKSIYEDKLTTTENLDNSITISMMIYPSTADDEASQYVRLMLELTVSEKWQTIPVKVNLRTSRGLSDDQLRTISNDLTCHAQSNVGDSVLFDLIEMAKDALTNNNLPNCPCPICLVHFQDFDDFFKTNCYHYLHSYCMYQYVLHWSPEEKESLPLRINPKPVKQSNSIPCPVCRKSLPYDIDSLSESTKPIETPEMNYNFDDLKKQVKKMEEMYNRQKEVGGIIDLEKEKNKYLLSSIEEAYLAASSSSSTNSQRSESKSSSPVESHSSPRDAPNSPTIANQSKRSTPVLKSKEVTLNYEHHSKQHKRRYHPNKHCDNDFKSHSVHRHYNHKRNQNYSDHQRPFSKPSRNQSKNSKQSTPSHPGTISHSRTSTDKSISNFKQEY